MNRWNIWNKLFLQIRDQNSPSFEYKVPIQIWKVLLVLWLWSYTVWKVSWSWKSTHSCALVNTVHIQLGATNGNGNSSHAVLTLFAFQPQIQWGACSHRCEYDIKFTRIILKSRYLQLKMRTHRRYNTLQYVTIIFNTIANFNQNTDLHNICLKFTFIICIQKTFHDNFYCFNIIYVHIQY